MDVGSIIRDYLTINGFDGLYDAETECGCEVSDLFPCEYVCPRCTPGHKLPCDCGDHDFHIGSKSDQRGRQ